MNKITKFLKKIKDSPFAFFFAKKVAFLFVAIVISMTVVFVLPRLLPRGPVDMMISSIAMGGGATGSIGEASPGAGNVGQIEIISEIYREKFGITASYPVQYLNFWKSLLTMDFGKSFAYDLAPVSEVIAYRLPWTMALVLPVIPVGFVIGNWIGSRAAYRRGRLDKILYYFSMYLWRAPYFWFAMIFMLIFSLKLGWFPVMGAYNTDIYITPQFTFDWFKGALYHYILPFLSLVGLGIGGWAVGMRAMTLYEMESDYMTYAEQLGFSKGKLRKYAERNAILPNFTWIPIVLNMLVGQTLLVEVIFKYPGMGTVFYEAIFSSDYPLIQAGFVITLLLVLMGNFVADLIYGKLDPRIGTAYVGEE